jgi:hypothetical protein
MNQIRNKSRSPVAAIKEESMTDEELRNLAKSPDFGNPEIVIQDEA